MPKAKSIYIFGAEPQAGKSVVLLGIMELLSRHVQKLGFFRPLVHEGETKDDAIRLISNRYRLPFSNRVKYGMTFEKARTFVAEEKYDEVLKRINTSVALPQAKPAGDSAAKTQPSAPAQKPPAAPGARPTGKAFKLLAISALSIVP